MTHQAIQQAYALGYTDGDQLHVRLFAGKGFDVKEDKLYPVGGYLTVGSWEFYKTTGKRQYKKKDGLKHLKELNDKGYGVYLVVNKGGHADGDITDCVALFYECDDISKLDQWERINRLPVEPSIVIEARKSLHVYYRLNGHQVEEWRKYQQRLIQLMESDPSIHNESRLMRLAGFDHQAKDLTPYPVTIAGYGDGIYSRELFDGLLPGWDTTKWSELEKDRLDEAEIQARLAELKQKREIVGDTEFPLEICLTKADRSLIDDGTVRGQAHTDGYRLACNLVATEQWLYQAGYRFTGSAEDLFLEFAYRSQSQGLYTTSASIYKVFNSAKKRANHPSLSPEAMENCILAWRKKQSGYDPAQLRAYQHSLEKRREIRDQGNILSKLSQFALKLWRSAPITTIKNGGEKATRLVLKEDHEGAIVQFARGQGARIYEEAARLGYKYILDCSPTGAGKTHTVGQLRTKSFFVFEDEEDDSFKRLIYFSQSPRNPNSDVIETDFFEMPTRNKGFQLNYDKLTPAGSPTRSKIEDEDLEPELRTKATCHLTDVFLDCYAKGHDPKGICGGCEHFSKCKTERGEGYGYLYLTKAVKGEEKIHAHLRGIPEKLLDENVVAVVDESEMAEWTTGITIREDDVREVFGQLKEYDLELYKKLWSVKDVLMDLLGGKDAPRWGWIYADLEKKFFELEGLEDYLAQIKEFELQSRPAVNELIKGKALHQNFLHELIAVVLGRKSGSLSAGNNTVTITVKNQRMVDSLKATHCTIFQDATHSREQLAIALGVPESEILVIRQESSPTENLTVKQYVGAGKLGNQRSNDEMARAGKIREYFTDTLENHGFIEYKAHAKSEDLIHGGDGRGSNAFQHKLHVISMGLYRPNMGAILNEYQALTGKIVKFDDDGFKRYYGHKVASTVVQEIGRLRANRRSGEELTYHIVSEGNLTFLEELGIKLEVIDIGTIDTSFATIENRVQARNQAAAEEYIKEFGLEAWNQLSQNKFSVNLGITPQALSDWCKRYIGSFERFKQMVAAIFNPQPESNLSEDDEGEVDILATGLIPMLITTQLSNREFSEALKEWFSPFKWQNVLEAIKRLTLGKSIRLLFRIMRVCKDSYATC